MAKRCGSLRRYIVNIGRPLSFDTSQDLPLAGDVPYEERTRQCQKQFGHAGKHGAFVNEEWLEWPDPY